MSPSRNNGSGTPWSNNRKVAIFTIISRVLVFFWFTFFSHIMSTLKVQPYFMVTIMTTFSRFAHTSWQMTHVTKNNLPRLVRYYRAEVMKSESQEEENFRRNFRNLTRSYLNELTWAEWLIWYDLLIWPDQLIRSGWFADQLIWLIWSADFFFPSANA